VLRFWHERRWSGRRDDVRPGVVEWRVRIDGENDRQRHSLPERGAIGSAGFDRAPTEHGGIPRADHELGAESVRTEADLSLDRSLGSIVERLPAEPAPHARGELALAEAGLGAFRS
jgi:hypothetical protein